MIYQESKGLFHLNGPNNLQVKDFMETPRGVFTFLLLTMSFALNVKQNQAKLV